jgi:3-hydroxyisobutyrate dehydrogenase-like beta-hydroxyacid dehydrogenase
MKVGFIGVGNMGGPMCRNIIRKSNQEIVVFDLNAAAVKACTDLGATAAASIAEVASTCDVVMTSLPMPKDVEAVALGPGGIMENARKGTIYIDLSTNSPKVMKHIAERMTAKGLRVLDAPVSGGTTGAEAGTIAIMVGGDAATFEEVHPLLRSFTGNVYHLGGIGTGCIAKIVNNMMSFCNACAGAEGLMLGTLAGIDPKQLARVVATSSGNSNSWGRLSDRAMSGDFTASFALDLAYKDMRLALELAEEVGMPLMIAPQVHNMQRMARAAGLGSADSSVVLRVYETALKREVRSALNQRR